MAQGFATVVLPVTTNDAACWADTSGGLKDCGTPTVTSLSGDTTFYVNSSTGNDANVCTISSTCATIQRAMNIIATLFNLGGFTATINVTCTSPPCSYASAITVPTWTGAGSVVLSGDSTTPSNVVISATINMGNNTGTTAIPTTLAIKGFKLTGNPGISVIDGSALTITDKMDFGGAGTQINVTRGSNLKITATAYNITAAANSHIQLNQNSVLSAPGNPVVAVTNNLAFSPSAGFISLNRASTTNYAGMTFTGSGITGLRYSCTNNSVLSGSTTANSIFPGNANGSPTSGCQAP